MKTRTVVPIYSFTYWRHENNSYSRGGNFEIDEIIDNAHYKIYLKELVSLNDEFELHQGRTGQNFTPLFTRISFGSEEAYVLVIDKESTDDYGLRLDKASYSYLFALKLLTVGGFHYPLTYTWDLDSDDNSLVTSSMGYNNPFIARNSRFSSSQLPELGNLAKIYRNDSWRETELGIIFSIVNHSISYLSNQPNPRHAYIVLMIAFESLFKRTEERNLTKASVRIGKLLCDKKTNRSRKIISNQITNDDDGLSKIRNLVAHGSPSFNNNDIISAIHRLLPLLQESIINIMKIHDLSPSEIGDGKYYDWLDEKIVDVWESKPAR